MPKILRKRVNVQGQWYGPGPVGDDVAELVTNPKAWADDDSEEATVGATSPRRTDGPRLARRVSIDGAWYGPDDDVPTEVARRIGNPKAWEGGRVPRLRPEGDGASGSVPAGGGATPTDGAGAEPSERQREFEATPQQVEDLERQSPPRVPAPPRSGKGSGKEAWETYLRASGVEVDADASREDMIAAAEDAGLVDKE